jgi:hypothetical protein
VFFALLGSAPGCGAKSALWTAEGRSIDTSSNEIEGGTARSAAPTTNTLDAASPLPEPHEPQPKPPAMRPPKKSGDRDAGRVLDAGSGPSFDAGANDAEPPPPPDAPTGPIDIGIVRIGESDVAACSSRFVDALGDQARVGPIDAAADYATFHAEDLIVACSNWAEFSRPDVLGRSDIYTRFVQEGGGLLMFQPNPYPLDSLRVDLLPEWFVVATYYTDQTVSIVDPNHPVTIGLTNSDMPYPADRITDFSSGWTVLSRGDQSGDASLIVADIGRGRAAIDGAHHVKGIVVGGDNNSDALIRRLSLWLTHRL